jgi:helix-turn-helix protein
MHAIILRTENGVNDVDDGGSVTTTDLLLHPVRLRVVQALLGDRVLTTADLATELGDVPTATLYRQVAVLADAGVLQVVGERKARGAVERSYRLVLDAAAVSVEDTAAMTADEHRRGFAAFVAALLADFDRYLRWAATDGGAPDLLRDGAGYRQAALWLTDEELAHLVADLRAAISARMDNAPTEGRRRRVLSTVLMPGEPYGPRRN